MVVAVLVSTVNSGGDCNDIGGDCGDDDGGGISGDESSICGVGGGGSYDKGNGAMVVIVTMIGDKGDICDCDDDDSDSVISDRDGGGDIKNVIIKCQKYVFF